MMSFFDDAQLSTLLFAGLSLAAMAWVHFWLRRTRKTPGVPVPAWLFLLLFIAFGALLADKAAESESASLRRMLEGFAPTYANELEHHGHERIKLDTPPEDPLYLSMIESQIEWLKINPLVNDIYTFRMKEDGTVVLLVDSETDYDRDGRYEGDRESRTAIGEVYPEADENLKLAFQGTPSFDGVPYTDRWGTWVSAYTPMRDSQGRVEAVLGVDYSAKAWVEATSKRRAGMLGYVGIAIIIYIVSIVMVLLGRYEKSMMNLAQEKLLKATSENLRLVQAERDYTAFIMESAPVVICSVGADGRMNSINPAGEKVTGYAARELIGRNFWDAFYPGEERGQVEKLFEALLKNNSVKDYEMTLTTKTGQKRTVSWNAIRCMDGSGKLVEIVSFGSDVTERKELESQLLQSQKMDTVGTLAGGIAHDLNNQLTPLAGYIDLLMKEMTLDDPNRLLLAEAEQAARRCAEVVQRLMGFSRASTQKKGWFKTDLLLDELQGMLPKFLPRTIEVRVEHPEGLWPLMGNETELQTVFMNLAANARDAMPEGGVLRISVENRQLDAYAGYKPGPHLVFTVTDTGKGIPPEALSKIFEPFFTTKQKGQGTGLGLAMVFRIIKDHGGWIEVSSAVGKGSAFTLYFPTDPKQSVGKEVRDSTDTLPRGSETILFVDDEETLRNIGRVFLERLGYKVLLAKDGEEAVQLYTARQKEIDAVVMDMTMPKLTGRQAMKKMMEIDPKVRVLLASGYTSEGSAKELVQDGAVDFLPKPYTILPLAQALRKVIGRS